MDDNHQSQVQQGSYSMNHAHVGLGVQLVGAATTNPGTGRTTQRITIEHRQII